MSYSCLKELKNKYPDINIFRVLAYMPKADDAPLCDSLLPESQELCSPRFAISKRNIWMIEHSSYVVFYVNHSFGGASKFVEIAHKKKKHLIDISVFE